MYSHCSTEVLYGVSRVTVVWEQLEVVVYGVMEVMVVWEQLGDKQVCVAWSVEANWINDVWWCE